jgi:CubicO group peptidase (beta-lactamase class C family)
VQERSSPDPQHGFVATAAQPPKSAGVNSTVASQIPQRMKSFVDARTVAGMVTLVSHGDDVIVFDEEGMADVEAGHPMQKDTIFQIMSMTKPVTAIGHHDARGAGQARAERPCRAIPARVSQCEGKDDGGTGRGPLERSRSSVHDS